MSVAGFLWVNSQFACSNFRVIEHTDIFLVFCSVQSAESDRLHLQSLIQFQDKILFWISVYISSILKKQIFSSQIMGMLPIYHFFSFYPLFSRCSMFLSSVVADGKEARYLNSQSILPMLHIVH